MPMAAGRRGVIGQLSIDCIDWPETLSATRMIPLGGTPGGRANSERELRLRSLLTGVQELTQ